MNRTEKILSIRPALGIDIDKEKTSGKLHHAVLRPILKLQHDLLQSTLKANPHFSKQLLNIDAEDPKAYYTLVSQLIKTNKALRFQYIGMVIGLMSIEELLIYQADSAEYNKRIIQMLIKRLGSK